MEKRKVIRVFSPSSFEGVTRVAIIEDLLKDNPNVEIQVEYTTKVDFNQVELFRGASIVVVLGIPYKGYSLSWEFFSMFDNPFSEFLHFSTYGKELPGEGILSVVDPHVEPIQALYSALESNPKASLMNSQVTTTTYCKQLIQAVNLYRTWQWKDSMLTKTLVSLYKISYKNLPSVLREGSLQEVVKKYGLAIQAQMLLEKEYLDKKLRQSKTYSVNISGVSCDLIIVSAEESVNDVAKFLLERYPVSAVPTIACIIVPSANGDRVAIRTKGIHAGDVARELGGEGENKNASSVFLGAGYTEIIGNSIATKLNNLIK